MKFLLLALLSTSALVSNFASARTNDGYDERVERGEEERSQLEDKQREAVEKCVNNKVSEEIRQQMNPPNTRISVSQKRSGDEYRINGGQFVCKQTSTLGGDAVVCLDRDGQNKGAYVGPEQLLNFYGACPE